MLNKMEDYVKNFNKKKKKGFTLVELLIVIVIIGILFAVLISRVDFATDKARETGVKADMRSYQTAIEQVFREQAGYKPGTDGADLKAQLNGCLDSKLKLTAVTEDGGTITAKDPWGTAYTIEHGALSTGGANDGYILIESIGPNAKDEAATVNTGDGVLTMGENSDNYALYSTWIKGELRTTTQGFSQNIE